MNYHLKMHACVAMENCHLFSRFPTIFEILCYKYIRTDSFIHSGKKFGNGGQSPFIETELAIFPLSSAISSSRWKFSGEISLLLWRAILPISELGNALTGVGNMLIELCGFSKFR
mmetsp:Transcript_13022/g.18435  ORF Transcript_13022/g.18435 Transcript_13022/m.18435 type:complete len:115 (-) Transcript_13022:842-1186(-)